MSPAGTCPEETSQPRGSEKSPQENRTEKKPQNPALNKFNFLVGNHDDFLEGRAQDTAYEYAKYMPTYPDVKWEPLGPVEFIDKGHKANPKKTSLLEAATGVDHLTPLIGTEISGVDLRYLTEQQKNDLALLVAERGVVFFRNQDIAIEEQIELSRHFGPSYKHPCSGYPKGLEEVHVVYTDAKMRMDTGAFAKRDIWHSDVTFENQPPGIALLKLMSVPATGGDTLWGSCTGLYSTFSPHFQAYLDTLQVVHSGQQQAEGAQAMGWPIRRDPIDTVHPLVRVHPVTGWKSIFVNAAFTSRIVGVPKSESDAVLGFLYREMAENPELNVRYRWKKNDVAIWDNRITCHSAIGNAGPHIRHGLRAMNTAEKPLSVSEYERVFEKVAVDRKGRLEVDPQDHSPAIAKEAKSAELAASEKRKGPEEVINVENVEEALGNESPPSTPTTTSTIQSDQPQRSKWRRYSWKLSDRKISILAPFHWVRIIK